MQTIHVSIFIRLEHFLCSIYPTNAQENGLRAACGINKTNYQMVISTTVNAKWKINTQFRHIKRCLVGHDDDVNFCKTMLNTRWIEEKILLPQSKYQYNDRKGDQNKHCNFDKFSLIFIPKYKKSEFTWIDQFEDGIRINISLTFNAHFSSKTC